MKTIVRISLAVVALGVFANAASAQTTGNVVWGAVPGAGVSIAADWGMTMNDDAKALVGGESGMYFGGRLGYGADMFGVYAAGGMYPIGIEGVDGEMTLGGGLAFHAINKAETPLKLSIQGGVGYIKQGEDTRLDFIGGAVIGFTPASTGVSFTPWVMPRVQYVTVTDEDGEFGFGASGGVNVDFPQGFGFHAGIDWLTIGDPSISPMQVGAGLHYTFKTPS
jgi:hypothetical protein